MKRLKFAEPLPELVLNRTKDTTWRINDDKNLSVNDELSLCRTNNEEFAKAKILWIKETTFENLTDEDKKGHEPFSSEEDMQKTYMNYYNIKITPQTNLKVIKFRLLS